MKSVMLLLTASLSLFASAALADDDACSKKYGACMDHCSSRPASVQGTCTQTCESNTNQCYVGVYGPAPANNPPVALTAPAAEAQGSAAAPVEGKKD